MPATWGHGHRELATGFFESGLIFFVFFSAKKLRTIGFVPFWAFGKRHPIHWRIFKISWKFSATKGIRLPIYHFFSTKINGIILYKIFYFTFSRPSIDFSRRRVRPEFSIRVCTHRYSTKMEYVGFEPRTFCLLH